MVHRSISLKAKDLNSPSETAMGGEKSPMASTRDGRNADFPDALRHLVEPLQGMNLPVPQRVLISRSVLKQLTGCMDVR
ncbi:hypothetical protein ILFOPFJJ_06948 [Ensifer psoraleae]|nr:hypothetical protein [Sinorhizobium psoraleae]